jgi:hypothetical protein
MTKCGSSADCPSGTACNASTGQCVRTIGASCSTTAPEPDVCSYGQYCASGGTCQEVPAPTCPNFVGSSHGTSWSASTSSGPIIYDASKVSFATDTAFCPSAPTQTRVKVHVKAYWTSGTFSSNEATFAQGLHYVRTDGIEGGSVANQIQALSVTNNGHDAELDLNFCVDNSLSQFTGGLHFVDGNEFCFVIQK